jgi:hypothetical protein
MMRARSFHGGGCQNRRRFAMRRFVISLSVVVVLLLGGVAAMERGATAQDATPDTTALVAMATHPIVGTWRFVRDFGEGPTITYGIFHADGTYFQQAYAGGPLNFGAWEPTGERAADMRFRQVYAVDDQLVEAEARYAFTVDEAGDALEGQGVYVSRFVDDGSLDVSFETASPGTHITAAPLVSLETLIAETEPQATPVP